MAASLDVDVAEVIVRLMAPIAPHWANELWHEALGHKDSVHAQSWPDYDEEKAKAAQIELAVQINGKVRTRIMVDAEADEETIREAALAEVESALEGKTIRKVVVVPSRLVNIVAN